MMKKCFLFSLTLFSVIAFQSTSIAQNMNVVTDNGTVSYTLTNLESIVFKNGIFKVKDAECGDNYYSDFYTQQLNFGTAVSGLSNQSFFELQLFPNPSTEQITIQSNGVVGEIGKIVNLSGKTIQTFPLESTSIVIDIHQLDNGVYFVLIGTQTIKFIKQ